MTTFIWALHDLDVDAFLAGALIVVVRASDISSARTQALAEVQRRIDEITEESWSLRLAQNLRSYVQKYPAVEMEETETAVSIWL
jgi:hypothetical protein